MKNIIIKKFPLDTSWSKSLGKAIEYLTELYGIPFNQDNWSKSDSAVRSIHDKLLNTFDEHEELYIAQLWDNEQCAVQNILIGDKQNNTYYWCQVYGIEDDIDAVQFKLIMG